MREEFEKLVFAGKIKPQQVDQLVTLAEGGYCSHKSWGFGRITTVDTVFSKFAIDFLEKPGHAMDLGFAADTLTPIPAEHVLARKMSDLESLKQMAALHHLDLIKVVLQSFDGKATLDTVQKILVPDVIASDWKKWWEVARREMKKDGHFRVPTKKTENIEFTENVVSLQDRLLNDLKNAKGLKARTAVATEIFKSLEDLTDGTAAATEAVKMLSPEISGYLRTQPAASLEAIFVSDDLRKAAKLAPEEGDLSEKDAWEASGSVGKNLEKIPAARHRRVLQSFIDANPESWTDTLLDLANSGTTKLCSECVAMLLDHEKLAELKERLLRLISQHQASTELLLWLAKERSDTYADILGPEVFRAMITAIERDQFNEKKSVKLADFVLSDHELLPELIESADVEVVKDLTRALQASASFDDMDKRSLLARIVKSFPAIQELISGEQQAREDNALIVSWESLERRKNEYEDLVKRKIPANSKDIAIARSYGDLRENHEYKSAKENQKVLMRRKSELERDLGRTRGTNFADARSDVVGIGSTIEATDLNSNENVAFEILGAWDGDPDKGVLSYLSPMAQAMINHKAGEEVEFELHDTTHRFRLNAIGKVEPHMAPQAPEGSTDVQPAAEPSAEPVTETA